jgi:hypothetical protein
MAAKTDSPSSAHTYEEYKAYLIKQLLHTDDERLRIASFQDILDVLSNPENDSCDRLIKELRDKFDTDPEFRRHISAGEWSMDTLHRYFY